MSATAVNFGDGRWGIGADQTGMIIESITHDYTNSSKTVKDRTGNTSGITYYDEMVKISLDGKVPKTTTFSGTLATALTLGNSLSSYLKGDITGGSTLIEGITLDYNQEDYQGFKVQATYYPNVP
jgi:hypothetical protein